MRKPFHSRLLFFLILLIVCNSKAKAQIPCNPEDSLALIALYKNTNGPKWKVRWNLTESVESYYGVKLDSAGYVTSLILSNNNLNGAIPEELFQLKNIRALKLANNYITGSIDEDIGNLEHLKYLHLHNNRLSGTIPSSIGNLVKLEELYLYSNLLIGRIPNSIGNLTQLQRLYLNHNNLSGEIPTIIGLLTNLEHLYLQNNFLEGRIPNEMGQLHRLVLLYLSDNNLLGSIPTEFKKLVNLESLILEKNKLSGSLPEFLAHFPRLSKLILRNNDFSGCFPSSYLKFCDKINSTNNQEYKIDFNENLELPWFGNISKFCEGLTQIGAVCKDKNDLTIDDTIQEDCRCDGCDEFQFEIVKTEKHCINPVTKLEIITRDSSLKANWKSESNSALNTMTFSSSQTEAITISLYNDVGCTYDTIVNVSIDTGSLLISDFKSQLTCTQTEIDLIPNANREIIESIWLEENNKISTESYIKVTKSRNLQYIGIANNGCRDTANFIITSDTLTPIPIVIKNDSVINCNNEIATLEFELSENQKIRWDSEVFSISNQNRQSVFEPISTTIAFRDESNGCTSEYTWQVVEDLAPPKYSVTLNSNNCNSPLTSISLESDEYDIVGNWEMRNQKRFNSTTFQTNLSDSLYLEVVGQNGCRADTVIWIELDTTALKIFDEQAFISCGYKSVLLTPNSNRSITNYRWSKENQLISTNESIEIEVQGTYQLIGTSINGCIDTAYFDVLIDTSEISNNTVHLDSTINCSRDIARIELELDPNQYVLWEDIEVKQVDEATYWTKNEGQFSYRIVDSVLDCTSDFIWEVKKDLTIPTIEVYSDTLTCINPQATLNIINPDMTVTYDWSSKSVSTEDSHTFVTTVQDSIHLTATGVNGCSIDTTFWIESRYDPINASIFDTINCTKEKIKFESTTHGIWQEYSLLSFDKKLLDKGPEITINSPGSYYLVPQEFIRCHDTIELHIERDTIKPLVNYLQYDDTVSCTNDTAKILLDLLPHEEILWSNNISSNSSYLNTTSAISVEGIITNKINGCSTPITWNVAEDFSIPNYTINPGKIDCEFFKIEQTIWIEDNAKLEFQKLSNEVNLQKDTIKYFKVTGTNGCEAYDSITTIYLPERELKLNDIYLNCLNLEEEIVLDPTLEDDLLSLFIFDELGDTISRSTISFDSTFSQSDFYFEGTLSNGCVIKDTIKVEKDFGIPLIELNIQDSICSGNLSFNLGTYRDTSYNKWVWANQQKDSIISKGAEVSLNRNGYYTMQVLNLNNGCSFEEEFQIFISENPFGDFNFDIIDESCQNLDDGAIIGIDIDGGSGNITYALDDTLVSNFVENLKDKSYLLRATDQLGCFKDTLIQIYAGNVIDIVFDENLVLLSDDSIIIAPTITSSDSILNYRWISNQEIYPFNTSSITLDKSNFDASGVITIIVEDVDGCIMSDSTFLKVKNENETFYLPNVISNSSVRGNNIFEVEVDDNIQSINSFRLYNRWGQCVYKNEAFNKNKSKIELLNMADLPVKLTSGVYVYKLEYINAQSKPEWYRGDLTIIE